MTQRGLGKRLSAQDASFLYMERKGAPLHIGSLAIFEGQIDYNAFGETVASKLHLIPRYQQIPTPAPFNIGHPTWEWDQNFDINKHIMRTSIDGPATDEALFAKTAELFAPMLSRDRPVWEMYIINNLEGDRSALISKVHHCLVDGVSGVELFMLVLDVSPTPIPPAPAPEIEKPPAEPPLTRIMEAILDNALETVDAIANAQNRQVSAAYGESSSRAIARAIESALPYLQVPVTRTPFNRPFTGSRQVAFSEYSFQEIRQIRQSVGGTINDVVLAVLGGGVGKYLEMHGQSTADRSLRVMTPVNVRREDERNALGNRVSALLVEVPVGISNPLDRLETIRKRTEALKRRQIATGVESLGDALNSTPPMLQALAGQLPPPPNTLANMVCTNVPGPMIPLYTVGRRMISSFPLIPLAFEMGISLGVMSYDQKLYFGLMADAEDGEDVSRLKEFMDQAYVELRNAAGVSKSDLPALGLSAKEETPARHRAPAAAGVEAVAADAS